MCISFKGYVAPCLPVTRFAESVLEMNTDSAFDLELIIVSGKSLIKAPRMAANSYSPSAAPSARFFVALRSNCFFEKVPTHVLELDIQPFGLHVWRHFLEDIDHGLWASLESLVEELLDLPLLRGIFQHHGSLKRFQQVFHPRSRASNLVQLSRSSGIAIELHERSRRRASLSQDKARRHADSASIGAYHSRPN